MLNYVISCTSSFCPFCCLRQLTNLFKKEEQCIRPHSLVDHVQALNKGFRPRQQEDCHEYVRALLEATMRAEVFGCKFWKTAGHVSWERERETNVFKTFGGLLQSQIQCSYCQHVSTTSEPFLDLSLDVTGGSNLQGALSRFTKPEKLAGDNAYRCSRCKSSVEATKRISIRSAPNVLTVHFKRFDRHRKDNRSIKYPEQLDISAHMPGRPSVVEPKYELYGVVVHQGPDKSSGHYLSYVKTGQGWVLKNDASTKMVSAQEALRQKAYMLFYSRKPTQSRRRDHMSQKERRKYSPQRRKHREAQGPMAQRMEGSQRPEREPSPLKRFLSPLRNSRGTSGGSAGSSSSSKGSSKGSSSPLRAVIISGTGAVRKVISRVFGLPGSAKKAPAPSSTPERTITTPIRKKYPDRDWENIRYPPSPAPKQMDPTKGLFGSGVWFDADGVSAQGEERSFTRSRIVKRRRASDEVDGLYDLGKRKRSRREAASS